MNHPYKNLPDTAYWSRSISNGFNPSDLIPNRLNLFKKGDIVTSAGSCFASNLIPYIENAGLTYIRTEKLPSIFSELGQNLGYANFSAAYGNIYTARQLRQLYERALGIFQPVEDRWKQGEFVIDPLRPGLKFPARSNEEFDFLTREHLLATKKAFESADIFVFTLGLTEGWILKTDGTTYPACPGTIAGTFDSSKYQFKNFSVDEIVEDVTWFIETLRLKNKKIRFILSVSPVPLVATASNNHVLTATTYSKSVLRVAAEIISTSLKDVTYFPAYEIITGPQAPNNFFEEDRRNVSKIGVEFVMKALLAASKLNLNEDKNTKTEQDLANKNLLSRTITSAECDEVMLDDKI